MKLAVWILLAAGVACAHKPDKTPVGEGRPLTKTEALALQGLQARQQKITADQQALQADIAEYVSTACGVTQIPQPECQIDPTLNRVNHVVLPKPAPDVRTEWPAPAKKEEKKEEKK